ncbi:family A G protein-coupled receptor-like protein [Artomyces pyxidatus]|uniref:Family A G protein-coupled receptor-like protein n=1 Tax=Artomyces pyxidatus TaxID=48021 RepID=A0ACB8T5E7_9AGAM|nr:family A G protein-coupled receptor-like protein [Artomyces pyxidatus]
MATVESNFTSPDILANHALGNNPPTANLHISTHGSDWLWFVFSFMLFVDLAAIAFTILTYALQRPKNLVLHQLAIIILTTSSIAYFSMASDLGSTPIRVEFDRSHTGVLSRNIWYVRYIQWFINFPLALLALLIGTGFPLINSFITIFMADAAVVSLLVGSLVASTYKWGYYVMGCASLFYVYGHLLFSTARQTYPSPTGRSRGAFILSALLLAFVWSLFPLVWAFADGGNVISPTGEVVWYGLVDLLAWPVFSAFILYTHKDFELDAPSETKA